VERTIGLQPNIAQNGSKKKKKKNQVNYLNVRDSLSHKSTRSLRRYRKHCPYCFDDLKIEKVLSNNYEILVLGILLLKTSISIGQATCQNHHSSLQCDCFFPNKNEKCVIQYSQ